MRKYICFISIIILTISCKNENTVVEETEYFSFERPAGLALDTIIYSEEPSHRSAAQKAIGNDEYVDPNIQGEFIIDGISVHFILKNPKSNETAPCYCSDYTEEYLKRNGETTSENGHEYRIVEDTHWIELCIDMKHQFYVIETDEEKSDMIRKLLESIRMTPE